MGDLSDIRVIVVEDHVEHYSRIMRLLLPLGIEQCVWVDSGWDVVHRIDRIDLPDVIFLNLDLPGEDGFAVQQAMHTHEKLGAVRVIAVTGDRSPEVKKRARAAGFAGLLRYPLNAEHCTAELRHVLAGIHALLRHVLADFPIRHRSTAKSRRQETPDV